MEHPMDNIREIREGTRDEPGSTLVWIPGIPRAKRQANLARVLRDARRYLTVAEIGASATPLLQQAGLTTTRLHYDGRYLASLRGSWLNLLRAELEQLVSHGRAQRVRGSQLVSYRYQTPQQRVRNASRDPQRQRDHVTGRETRALPSVQIASVSVSCVVTHGSCASRCI